MPAGGKQPRAVENPESFYAARPSWRLARMQFRSPYGWHEVDGEGVRAIREKLANFESMTWAEIFAKAKKQNHGVPLTDLCAAAQAEAQRIAPDVDTFHTLHLCGKQRVWGIFSQGVFHILWWDPQHQVCPSLKRHT